MVYVLDNREEHIDAIKTSQAHMQKGAFDKALAQLEDVFGEKTNNIDALYMMAVCQRYLKKYTPAIDTLNTLKDIRPDFGRAYQEEGHLHTAMHQPQKALTAFFRATQFNPALDASWRAQVKLFTSFGDIGKKNYAAEQLERLERLPKQLLAATNLMHEGKTARAEDYCRQFLRANPKNTDGIRLLAEIGERFGAMDEAEFLLESAYEFEPDNIQVQLAFIDVLRKRQKFDKALRQAKRLYEQDKSNPVFQSQLAIQKMQSGEYEQSINLYEKVIETLPEDPSAWASKGHAEKTFGLQDDAIKSYQMSYRVRPDFGEGYFSLSNLKTYSFSEEDIENMQQQLEFSNLTYKDRILFCFALGKAYEDKAQYEKSFGYYKQGNEIRRKQSRYSSEQMTEELSAQKRHCKGELFKTSAKLGCSSSDPIFILGLPRAGSTLLEQIIASHSQVDGTHELSNVLSLAHKLRGKGRATGESNYPANLNALTEDQLKAFGERYIEETKIHRQGAPYFIDKMPNNFRHIGLIHLILPNAKIIDARRHPMACCFSGFKQHFAEGQEFTYGLKQVGKYYRDYVQLMDHWDEVIPGKILRVQYEDVVADIEDQVRRILDYLNLPFEQACIDFHKNKRSVRTASSEQVRQPIFKSGLEQWRNFGPWLDPLKEALGPEILKRYPI